MSLEERAVSLDANLLARLKAMLPEPVEVGAEEIAAAREVLAQLSERSYDGQLRDAIGEVRHALSEWADEIEPTP